MIRGRLGLHQIFTRLPLPGLLPRKYFDVDFRPGPSTTGCEEIHLLARKGGVHGTGTAVLVGLEGGALDREGPGRAPGALPGLGRRDEAGQTGICRRSDDEARILGGRHRSSRGDPPGLDAALPGAPNVGPGSNPADRIPGRRRRHARLVPPPGVAGSVPGALRRAPVDGTGAAGRAAAVADFSGRYRTVRIDDLVGRKRRTPWH